VQDNCFILASMLAAIRRDLEAALGPEITSPRGRATAGMMSELLAYLTVWQRDLNEHQPQISAAQKAALDKAVALLEQVGGAVPPSAVAGDGAGAEVERLQRELDQTIEALTNQTSEALGRISADAIQEVLAQSVDSELELLERELERVDTERQVGQPTGSDAVASITEASLTDFVRNEFPGDMGASIKDLVPVSDGFVKDTYSFTVKASTGRCRRLVLRRDLPFGAAGSNAVDEFALIQRLYEFGFPVAEPVYCESDARPLGQPFMLLAFVEGQTGTEAWEEDREARYEICFALARILGRLHNLPPERIAPMHAPLGETPQAHLRAYIGKWHDLWLRRRLHASPTLTAAFHWLFNNIPSQIDRLALIHGDVSFDNILVRGGNIQALLDWDLAHLGDPIEELDHCRQFVEPLASWPMFLEEYRAAGGAEYHDQNARFHAVWRSVRRAVTCSLAWHEFLNGNPPALRMAYHGVPQ